MNAYSIDGLIGSKKTKHLQTNDDNIKALGRFYTDNKGTYPTPETNINLQKFLTKKRIAYKDFINGTKNYSSKWYSTDEEVARQAGLPDGWMISKDYKKTNDDNLRELGRFYVTNGGTYPTRKTNSELAIFLNSKRQAYKYFINGTKTRTSKWYPTDEEVARQAGLPDGWMISKDQKQTNDDNLKALGIFYTDNKGTYPTEKTNIELTIFLNSKRQAYKHFINGNKNYKRKWYSTDEEVARQAGLPSDWMISRDSEQIFKDYKQTNDDNLRELGTFYVTNGGTYPTEKTNIKLATFLYKKRQAYKNFINRTKKTLSKWYTTDEEVARQAGLPSDWMVSRDIKTK